jgi:uncharacterized iron-regulated protein
MPDSRQCHDYGRRRLPARIGLLMVAVLTGCAGCQSWDAPRSPMATGDLLAGQIWDLHAQHIATREELLHRAASARYVLIGEVHDNPEHHRIERELLQALSTAPARPALAMEQLDTDYQTAIDAARAQPDATADTIAEAGHVDRKGWNWSSYYDPLVAIALRAKLPIVAINLARPTARRIGIEGLGTLDNIPAAQLVADTEWTAERDRQLRQEIIDGHCGDVPPRLLPQLVAAQRARDATMAGALAAHASSGAVAILGRGHARADIGVPIYLARRSARSAIVSIGLIEVEPDHRSARDYIDAHAAGLPFDFVWFTSAAQREDPCREITRRARDTG